jgi:alpha-tubulin suppressor-like RCC1 family protein
VVDVAAGPRHTCALLASGGVKCWGHNNAGELGDGSNDVRLVPVDVSPSILTSAASGIAVGEWQSCAITNNRREVTCWGAGYDDDGELVRNLVVRNAFAGAVRQVATSPTASCALLESGQVYCWGNVDGILPREQFDGLLSRILDMSDPYNPVLTTTELSPEESALRERVLGYPFWTNRAIEVQGLPAGLTLLTMSRAHTSLWSGLRNVAYTNTIISAAGGGRQVYWGQNYECEEVNEYLPRAIVCPPGSASTLQDSSNSQTLGLRTEVLRGEPVSIAVSYAAGGFTGCTTYANGQADCIGNGFYGSLGDGTLGDGEYRVAGARRQVVAWDPGLATRPLNNVAKLGNYCAITRSGALRCWGRRYAFAEPIDGQSSPVTGVAGSCALTASGRVECWRDGDAVFGTATDVGLSGVSQLGGACVLRSAQASALPTLACSRPLDPSVTVYTCGNNGEWCPRALAEGDLIDVPTDGHEIVALVAGQGEDHIRTRTGEWFAVRTDSSGGYRFESLAALGTNLVAVEGGSSLRCGLSALGQVRCIAQEYVYDFALQASTLRSSTMDIAGLPANPRSLTVAASFGGSGQGCVVGADGVLSCWRVRSNTIVELPGGDVIFLPDPPGGRQLVASPAQTPAGFSDTYESVSIGNDISLGNNICALTTSRQVKCAGRNERGQLGDRTYFDRTELQLVFAH